MPPRQARKMDLLSRAVGCPQRYRARWMDAQACAGGCGKYSGGLYRATAGAAVHVLLVQDSSSVRDRHEEKSPARYLQHLVDDLQGGRQRHTISADKAQPV